MIPPLPSVLAARHTIKAVWLALLVAVFVFVSGFAIVQTVRIEGFKFLVFEKEGYKAENKRLWSEIVALVEASKDAADAQQEVNDAAAKEYSNIAETINEDTSNQLETELDRADDFVRANSVRAQGYSGEPCRTFTPAPRDRTGNPENTSEPPDVDGPEEPTPPLAGVLVQPEDVRICTINTLKAEAAFDWATQIEAATDPDNLRFAPKSSTEDESAKAPSENDE